MRSPRITHLSWGRIETEDGASFKDAKLFPGGAREWDWNETGTRHEPGVQPADVEELLKAGVETVVIGVGFHERLGVCEETRRTLQERSVALHVLQTERAVRLYNELRENEKVGSLIHSTC
ncbi:MAG: Mth938-like domain-containing protein [Rubrobacteraceae bacterium]